MNSLKNLVGVFPKPVRLYGCHDRPPLNTSTVVQDGWEYLPDPQGRPGYMTRVPIMKVIPMPMSRGCHYDKAKGDSRCTDCKHIGTGEKP